jgi:hypothetical protein
MHKQEHVQCMHFPQMESSCKKCFSGHICICTCACAHHVQALIFFVFFHTLVEKNTSLQSYTFLTKCLSSLRFQLVVPPRRQKLRKPSRNLYTSPRTTPVNGLELVCVCVRACACVYPSRNAVQFCLGSAWKMSRPRNQRASASASSSR